MEDSHLGLADGPQLAASAVEPDELLLVCS